MSSERGSSAPSIWEGMMSGLSSSSETLAVVGFVDPFGLDKWLLFLLGFCDRSILVVIASILLTESLSNVCNFLVFLRFASMSCSAAYEAS